MRFHPLPLLSLLLLTLPTFAAEPPAPTPLDSLIQRAAKSAEPRFTQRDADNQITRLHLSNSIAFTDDDFALLAQLPKLRQLSFRLGSGNSRLTPRGVAATLPRLTGLTQLALRCNPLDDSILQSLAPLTRLETLDLEALELTAAGLPRLKPLANLKELHLGHIDALDDAALAALPDFPHLEHLDLRHTHITAAALPHLKRFPSLKVLNLDGTKLGDAALLALPDLPHLESLHLESTGLTDAGLTHLLNRHPKLKSLTLSPPITPPALDRLRATRPDLKTRYFDPDK